ncbi:IPT/TIG domain-containing protein [Paractinoplanes brasiliensis]|uniref:IPT/TIG domain-containing protein n=1 Tax=Paractinoplanes brasiliensis TaxID=52695 RepID=A0A4R6JZY5_9ACTN|nr:IPT/TIG domain-containing protein [Actinoplanes brasiliensis]TDO41351.1 hypothetical protein C8E87_5083 [Actinoplanes brasiliensis]GID27366.1 hypothetical protein Abr02nite_23490 [Actinoplanes brasiliensis]
MRKSNTTTRRRVRAGLAAGATGSLLTALIASPAYAAPGTLSLSSNGGPTGGGNTIVATLANMPTAPNPTSFTTSTAVYFVVATSATATPTCPTTYPSVAPAGTVVATGDPAVKLLAPSKIAVVVPTGVVTASAGTIFKYAMCAFAANTSGAALIAGGQYTVGTAPQIATVNGVNPVSGPALGGTTITVSGSGFVANTTAAPNNTVATLDGLPLTDIVVGGGGTSFSAKTPPHAPGGPFMLKVTTPGGTTNVLGTTTTKANLFSYTNGIVVSPNTAANTKGSVDLDVMGVGFDNYSFEATNGNTSNSANAHVYLVKGTYSATAGAVRAGKAAGQETECVNVLVISGEELLCSLPLNHTLSTADQSFTAGPAQRTARSLTTTTGSTTVTSASTTTTPAVFTQQDVGLPIIDSNSDTAIPAATRIVSVQSPTSATISAAALTTGTIETANIGGPKTLATVTVTDARTLTATAGVFSQADVGRVVTSTAMAADPLLPANTTIISVNSDGSVAKLSAAIVPGSNPLPASPLANDVVITPSTPVANGTYTVTVVSNGAIGASPQVSIISSGSTFTVADY